MGILSAGEVGRDSNAALGAWGTRPVSRDEVERFASHLGVAHRDRAAVVESLVNFQPDGMCRGMFFDALKQVVASVTSEDEALRLARAVGIKDRLVPFSLYPHRDFYRLWYSAIPIVYTGRPVAYGIERIAEIYFPVWLESRAGKTMAMFLGSTPETICKRLRDAYALSIPHNEHSLEFPRDGVIIWDATAEPSDFYPEALRGILTGAMGCQGVEAPKVSFEEKGRPDPHHRRWVFELDWT